MRALLLSLVVCVAIAATVFAATGGHVLFLPLVFLLPLGLIAFGRSRSSDDRA
jgi:hypothetical protein